LKFAGSPGVERYGRDRRRPRRCEMSETTAGAGEMGWTPWRVAPRSGFEVADPSGSVGIVQIDHERFVVLHAFRYDDPDVERTLLQELVDDGMDEAEARRAVDEARTFSPREDNPTDLASIPRFMRWFENPYGKHSLAALIHDELITDQVNGGRLGSDTLADRFFREMMRTSGVAWLKRWIMWSAVALRTRFAAGGLRRWSVDPLGRTQRARDLVLRSLRSGRGSRTGPPRSIRGGCSPSRCCCRSSRPGCGESSGGRVSCSPWQRSGSCLPGWSLERLPRLPRARADRPQRRPPTEHFSRGGPVSRSTRRPGRST
jgi:hypothetical protein